MLSLLLPLSILLHLAFAPYTKVEESFNIQATHDTLTYGVPFQNIDQYVRKHFDHITFSGAVPRTFVGPVVLAAASWPWIQLNQIFDLALSRQSIGKSYLKLFFPSNLVPLRQLSPAYVASLTISLRPVRAVLGLFNAYCLISFRNRVAKTFGRNAANWYVLFQASQFHVMYYASRTLPNSFAFGFSKSNSSCIFLTAVQILTRYSYSGITKPSPLGRP